jgi:hypothetical protein
MSTSRTNSFRRVALDHFEPDVDSDPHAQRRLRGQLEKIDYTVFTHNRDILGQSLQFADETRFKHLAQATAAARATWMVKSLALTEGGRLPSPEQVAQLAVLRSAYEELAAAYEGLRRLVERGYIAFKGDA